MVRMCECPVSQVDTGRLEGTFAFFIAFHIRALAVGPEEAVRGPPQKGWSCRETGLPSVEQASEEAPVCFPKTPHRALESQYLEPGHREGFTCLFSPRRQPKCRVARNRG